MRESQCYQSLNCIVIGERSPHHRCAIERRQLDTRIRH
jgi:hypothetical protein